MSGLGGVPDAAQRGRVALVPFGCHTRYILRGYVRNATMATAALFLIALVVDLSPRIWSLLNADAEVSGFAALGRIGWYCLIRSPDILTRLLPIGCFLGVLASETLHSLSLARLMISNTGRSPLQCIVPALLFAAAVGVIQYTLEVYVRPAGIQAQADARLGDYGIRFDRTPGRFRSWIASGDYIVKARIAPREPALDSLTVYELDPDGRISSVIAARRATPKGNSGEWSLREGERWGTNTSTRAPPLETEKSMLNSELSVQTSAFDELSLNLKLDPLWVSQLGITAKFLRADVLARLSNTEGGLFSVSAYRTWVQVRYASLLFPGGMALLAASLSLLLLTQDARWGALLGIALAGYAGHIGMKLLVLFGENGYVSPVAAAWTVPMLLWGVALTVLGTVEVRRIRA
jgi:lipopolysaccharide export system permease protein